MARTAWEKKKDLIGVNRDRHFTPVTGEATVSPLTSLERDTQRDGYLPCRDIGSLWIYDLQVSTWCGICEHLLPLYVVLWRIQRVWVVVVSVFFIW